MIRLSGETQGRPGTRDSLRTLLFQPEMRGVGYNEFLQRAIARAWQEIKHSREHPPTTEEHEVHLDGWGI